MEAGMRTLYVYQIEHAEGDHVFLSCMEPVHHPFRKDAICIGMLEVRPIEETTQIEGGKS